jgi:hypothetical protein
MDGGGGVAGGSSSGHDEGRKLKVETCRDARTKLGSIMEHSREDATDHVDSHAGHLRGARVLLIAAATSRTESVSF